MTRVYYQNITQVKRKLLITPRSCTNTAYITTTPQPQFKKKHLKNTRYCGKEEYVNAYMRLHVLFQYICQITCFYYFFLLFWVCFFWLLNIYHRLRLIKMCNLQHARPSA